MTDEPTVFVIDDNAAVRESMQALIASADLPVETFESGAAFLEAYDVRRPGCLILDVRLQGASGLDLQAELQQRGVTLPIIVLTGYADVHTSVRALKGGALDFLEKPVPAKALLARIREAIEVDRRTRTVAATLTDVTDRIAHLTPRERQVMELMAVGNSSKEIAAALQISVRTVEGHRREVLDKMGVESVAHLVRAVMRLERA